MDQPGIDALTARVDQLEAENRLLRWKVRLLKGLRLGTLIFLVALVGVALGIGPTWESWRTWQERERDRQVLEAALEDLLDPKNPENAIAVRNGRIADEIILSEIFYSSLYDYQFDIGLLDWDQDLGKDRTIPKGIETALIFRNNRQASLVSLKEFGIRNPRILVRNFEEEFGRTSGVDFVEGFRKKYPRSWGCVYALLPGYSRDGQTAVVLFREEVRGHPRTLISTLDRVGGRWTVRWRHLHFWE